MKMLQVLWIRKLKANIQVWVSYGQCYFTVAKQGFKNGDWKIISTFEMC